MCQENSAIGNKLNREMQSPFIHKCETKDNKYLYDLNTFRIVKVDPVIWDIVDDVGMMTEDEIVSKYACRYVAAEIKSACDTIVNMQKEFGLLLTNRPENIIMPLSEEQLKEKLDSERQCVILNVTEDCNCRCSYCIYSGKYTEQRPHSKRMMNWDTAHLALREYLGHNQDAKYKWISFFGGEPLLNISLIKRCVNYIRKERDRQDVYLTLTTNGLLLNGDIADFLASENFFVSVSLDGPPSIHDKHRRLKDGSPTCNQVVQNLKTFLLKYPKYYTGRRLAIHAVQTQHTDISELEKYFSDCGFLEGEIDLKILGVRTRGTKCYGPLKPTMELETLYKTFVKNLETGIINNNPRDVKLKVQMALFQSALLNFYGRGHSRAGQAFFSACSYSLPLCIPGIRRLFVTTEGNYYICEQSSLTENMRVGSVYEGVSVAKVRHMLEKYITLFKDECKFCWCLPTCNAICHVDVSDNGQFSKEAKHRCCICCRKSTHQVMVDMCTVLEKNPHAFDYSKSINLERFTS